jgi:hypothetical protein
MKGERTAQVGARAGCDRYVREVDPSGAVPVAGVFLGGVHVPEVRGGAREFGRQRLVVGAQRVRVGRAVRVYDRDRSCVTGGRELLQHGASLGVQPMPADASSSGALSAARTRSPYGAETRSWSPSRTCARRWRETSPLGVQAAPCTRFTAIERVVAESAPIRLYWRIACSVGELNLDGDIVPGLERRRGSAVGGPERERGNVGGASVRRGGPIP